MKKKVDLIKAILYDGDIFILDEPFNGIDEISKDKIINLLKKLSETKLILIVTHVESECNKLNGIKINM